MDSTIKDLASINKNLDNDMDKYTINKHNKPTSENSLIFILVKSILTSNKIAITIYLD